MEPKMQLKMWNGITKSWVYVTQMDADGVRFILPNGGEVDVRFVNDVLCVHGSSTLQISPRYSNLVIVNTEEV